jgi:signal transduction histidine kinase
MDTNLLSAVQNFCQWDTSSFLIISKNVFDPLIYYSHIVPVLLSLPVAFIILRSDFSNKVNRYLFSSILLFAAWSFSDLVLWASEKPQVIMFFWSLLNLLEPLIYVTLFFFTYLYVKRKNPPTLLIHSLFFLSMPIFLFLPTKLHILSFDLTNCFREVIEGPLVFYIYLFEIVIVCMFFILLIQSLTEKKLHAGERLANILCILGAILFLGTFSSGNILASLGGSWTGAAQYGLFGMPIMICFLAYMIVRYQALKVHLVSAEFLIGILTVLILGIAFIQDLKTVHSIALITLALTIVIGFLLIKSLRKEIELREQIEGLVIDLEKANVRLKELDKMKSEFVSIASHQLRSPLTSIRGYASMLADGSYGQIPQKAGEVLEKIVESARFMALSIEDYLNVSRIEAGNMKYEMADFNIKDVSEKVVDEMRQTAIKKGLLLTFKSNCTGSTHVHADIGKTRQIIMNLVDNAIKYTEKGTVSVYVETTQDKKIRVSIKDTGIGMSKETQEDIFDKFVRAKNANAVNVTGTGLGLFVAKKMVLGMKGAIYAESLGDGQGSTFTIEFATV